MNKKEIEIYLPHLHYTIYVRLNSTVFLNRQGSECACEGIDKSSLRLHFRSKPKPHNFPSVAHEVMHAVQWICQARAIDMVREEEHCAYIMQYILNQILGYKYELWK